MVDSAIVSTTSTTSSIAPIATSSPASGNGMPSLRFVSNIPQQLTLPSPSAVKSSASRQLSLSRTFTGGYPYSYSDHNYHAPPPMMPMMPSATGTHLPRGFGASATSTQASLQMPPVKTVQHMPGARSQLAKKSTRSFPGPHSAAQQMSVLVNSLESTNRISAVEFIGKSDLEIKNICLNLMAETNQVWLKNINNTAYSALSFERRLMAVACLQGYPINNQQVVEKMARESNLEVAQLLQGAKEVLRELARVNQLLPLALPGDRPVPHVNEIAEQLERVRAQKKTTNQPDHQVVREITAMENPDRDALINLMKHINDPVNYPADLLPDITIVNKLLDLGLIAHSWELPRLTALGRNTLKILMTSSDDIGRMRWLAQNIDNQQAWDAESYKLLPHLIAQSELFLATRGYLIITDEKHTVVEVYDYLPGEGINHSAQQIMRSDRPAAVIQRVGERQYNAYWAPHDNIALEHMAGGKLRVSSASLLQLLPESNSSMIDAAALALQARALDSNEQGTGIAAQDIHSLGDILLQEVKTFLAKAEHIS